MSYCRFAKGHALHGPYHDREYGFPIRSDRALLERLALEINQAGLSWLTMLQKRKGFRRAYAGFDVAKVARFGARERRRLLADAGIIRNRLKVAAVIENARRILAIREVARLLREVARRPSPAERRRVAEALQGDVRLHRRGDRPLVPSLDRLPARCARAELPDLREGGEEEAGVDDREAAAARFANSQAVILRSVATSHPPEAHPRP